jgi:hypothetical protein
MAGGLNEPHKQKMFRFRRASLLIIGLAVLAIGFVTGLATSYIGKRTSQVSKVGNTSQKAAEAQASKVENGRPTIAKAGVETWKSIMEAVQSFATVIALIIGGIWTYKLFIEERESYPHVKISQNLTGKLISPEWYWIQLSITTENTGKSLAHIDKADLRVQQISPLPKNVIAYVTEKQIPVPHDYLHIEWKLLCRYVRPFPVTLEPGESDTNDVEFVIPAWLKTVKIYSYLENTSGEEYGWHATTIYDINGDNKDETEAMAKLIPSDDTLCDIDR